MNNDLFIFSGIDCSGKSTQIKLLDKWLCAEGAYPRYRWVRVGYTPLLSRAKATARLLLGKKRLPQGDSLQRETFMRSGWCRRLWLYLAIADLGFETAIYIRWLRLLGHTVVCDRYLLDSEIDLAMNFPEDGVSKWRSWKLVKRLAVRPDQAFLLQLSFEESLRRSDEKTEPFPENEVRRRQRANLYDIACKAGPWTVLDARRPIAELQKEVLCRITSAHTASTVRVSAGAER
jgi:thymidylate kinase